MEIEAFLARIRALTLNDLDELEILHNKYYSQFQFPDFMHMLNAFIIEDDDKSIILGGAVEKVAEAVLVTNKEKSRIKIGKALVEAQKCSMFTCKVNDIRELYAFVDNEQYAHHLKKHGFTNCHSALSIRIP